MLVTADGSIDCLQKPDAQEEVTSPLHYCEIITALQALSPGNFSCTTDFVDYHMTLKYNVTLNVVFIGGTFIFKLFTIFEHSTVSLLYLINHLFEEVNIYKPVTSRQGNSEVYAVCLHYKCNTGLEEFLSVLKSAYGTEQYGKLSLFPREAIPDSFVQQIEECQSYFCSIQCQVIHNNLQAYLLQNNIALHKDMKRVRALVATQFIWSYGLKPLYSEQEILKGILHEENKINTNPRYHRGSYTERELYTKMGLKEKCKSLSTFLQTEVLSNPMMAMTDNTKWIFFDDSFILELVFTFGRPLLKINSSKFIFVPIFNLYQQILAEDEFKDIIFSKNPKLKTKNLVDINSEGDKVITLSEYNYEEPYHLHEKRCFRILLKMLNELLVGESVVVRHFNTLTHFNVSILFILSTKCFYKTGFTSTGEIILNNLMNKDYLRYLDIIGSECDKMVGDETADVLNSLPVQVTNVGEFFNNVVFYNNTLYRNKCTVYLDTINQSM